MLALHEPLEQCGRKEKTVLGLCDSNGTAEIRNEHKGDFEVVTHKQKGGNEWSGIVQDPWIILAEARQKVLYTSMLHTDGSRLRVCV